MKQRLLSLIAMVALTVAAFAQTWTAPVAPTAPKSPAQSMLESAVDVEDGGNYYVMNVGEGQFLTGANTWATQISISANATPSMQITVQQVEGTESAVQFRRTRDNADTFYGDHGRENGYNPPAGRNILFRSGGDGYVDMNSQGGSYFKLTKNDSGYYYWQSSEEEAKFENCAEEYAGSTGAGKYVKFTCTIEDPNIEWAFIPVESVDLTTDYQALVDAYNEQMTAYRAEVELYEARLQLYNKLNEAVTYKVDYAAASTVYNNASATTEEIKAAYEALAPGVNRAAVLASIVDSSEDNPIDITSYVLVNPDFTQGNVDGWTVAQMGQNLGYQSNAIYTTEETGVSLNQFIEAWYPTSTGALGDGGLSQSLLGLPAGRYRLECDAIASWQGDENVEVVGVYLYYNNGSFTIHGEESLYTLNGKPQHFTFEFDYDGADAMTIGLMTSNTNANWVAADNFQLFAIGAVQTPAAYLALNSLYNEASTVLGDVEYAQASIKDACETALEEAEDLLSVSPDADKSDDYTAAYDKLNSALSALKPSIQAYKQFAELLAQLEKDDEEYAGKQGYEEYVTTVEALIDTYQPALEDGTYTTEQIEKAIEDYKPLLRQAVKKAFDEAVASGKTMAQDLDITPLFDQLSFVYSTSAKEYPSMPDSLWQNTTSTTKFKTQYGTAEVWNDTNFDVYRELDLPKGKYTITVNAFYREGDNATNYANFKEDAISGFSYLYAGSQQTLLFNVANLVTSEEVSGWYNFAGEDEDPLYVPNVQNAAHGVFTNEPYASQTINAVSTVLPAAGKLRFGIKSGEGLQENQWTVFENFRISYNAASASDYDADLAALIERAGETSDGGVKQATDKLEKAISAGEKALDATDADSKSAAINQLNEAISYAEKGAELALEITNVLSEYQQKLDDPDNTIDSKYDAFPKLLEVIDAAVMDETFESNEQIQGWLDNLPIEWLNYLLGWSELDKATGENPVDLTLMLTNPTFDENNYNGWTAEFETKNGTDADGCVEFWKSSAFDMYQKVAKLRPGFYRLSVNAFYRAGNSGDEVNVINTPDSVLTNNAFLYAGDVSEKLIQWSDTERGAVVGSLEEAQELYPSLNGTVYNLANETSFVAPNSRAHFQTFCEEGRYENYVIFEYKEGQGEIQLGIRKTEAVDNDWVPIDNFQLLYLGTEAPVAVEGIAADVNTAGVNAIYNLAGQKVSKVQKGIYIINGKKVAIK